jgi:hypothetical protein
LISSGIRRWARSSAGEPVPETRRAAVAAIVASLVGDGEANASQVRRAIEYTYMRPGGGLEALLRTHLLRAATWPAAGLRPDPGWPPGWRREQAAKDDECNAPLTRT